MILLILLIREEKKIFLNNFFAVQTCFLFMLLIITYRYFVLTFSFIICYLANLITRIITKYVHRQNILQREIIFTKAKIFMYKYLLLNQILFSIR
jgi:hypothetical protein